MSIISEKIVIRIDGKTVENYVFSEFRLTQELQKPCELRFQMYKNTMAETQDDIHFSISKTLLGKKIEFSLTTKRDDEDCEIYENETLEFTGIIFNAKLLRKNMKTGLVIEVTAYSPDYLLNDNPHCYSYENETLKNIVDKIVKPYSDITICNEPGFCSDLLYTVQYNETNYQFLSRLAYRFGQWLYYDGKELVFGNINRFDTIKLIPGYDILSYQYRLQLEHFNFTHAHHNYIDYENKVNEDCPLIDEEIHNMTDIAYEQSKETFSEKTFQHFKGSAPEENFYNEIDFSAQLQAWGEKDKLMICDGTTNRADLKIGSQICIKEDFKDEENESGTCFHDELLIVGITHYMNMNGHYENEFVAIPASSCGYPPYTYRDRYPKIESQRAVVKDNNDPEKLGRVRVQFLWQKEQDEKMKTPWIRIAQPYGGDDKGFYFIPEIDEEVMVAFENGNAERPYVAGTLWHGKQKPKQNLPRDNNMFKSIRTRNGHTINFVDAGEAGGGIAIFDSDKDDGDFRTYCITLDTDNKLIKLESKRNIELYAENDIILDAKHDIVMDAKHDIVEKAGNARDSYITKVDTVVGENVLIQATGGNVKMIASANIKAHADGNCDISASSDLYMQGATVNAYSGGWMALKASGENSLIGGGTVTIKGATVNIN